MEFGLALLAQIAFSDVTEQAGLVEPLAGIMGHGAAWGDADGDGAPDLFVGGFCDRPDAEYAPAAGPVLTRLLRNRGDGTFERVRQPALEFAARTSGALFVDLDNDGALELYVANNAKEKPGRGGEVQQSSRLRRNVLLRRAGGEWTDASAASGACPETLLTARNVGAFDYDADGLLDLLLIEDRFTPKPRSVLLRNKGGLAFEDVTAAAGLPGDLFGLGLATADLNADGRPDFFVAHSNRLFVSRPGGGYREAVELSELFAWHPLGGEDWPCGAAFGDVDGDGRPDLVVSAHHERARLRLYLGDRIDGDVPRFREVTREAGLDAIVPTKTPHVELQDFDNDGRLDLYVSAAWIEEGRVVPLVFRNVGGARLEPPRPIGGPMVYYPAGPSGDYDGDGRLDLFLVNWFGGRRCVLLKNTSPPRRRLDVRVVGRSVNRMGIGARVRVTAGERLVGVREISTGYGYASGQAAVAHFGLGDEARVTVEVTLPNGKRVVREGVAADQLLTVEEP